ncbi:YkvI family membrane protein [Corynebacterium halotolerans]|uniref:Membrane protein YkvI n=1 Tax=Corynebacterium halotolerans YIM 70093 = DSM 44683 TaxID=1121362 RepID=M1NWN4_9CORY|nr:hypothetical protein [Corynebacterium halotolerans]AGF71900.1 hypothetical protein A605_04445 [Corynebacterium halotolerans YIM 70093 = DSM 44683]
MIKRVAITAMAFVGLIVGAGFASGQEVLQYFVAFGNFGIIGAVVAAAVMMLSGMAAVQLGSYFLAGDHSAVLNRIAHPAIARALDIGVLVTLFSTGMVMFAGAGSNLNQQFGFPLWAGALLMLVLVVLAGLLDVDRVTQVIGAITPLIIVFLAVAISWALTTNTTPAHLMEQASTSLSTTLPHWTVSAVNYVGFNLMVGVSMAIIIGGSQFDPRSAGWGGLLGGIVYGALLVGSAIALFVSSARVGDDDMPMLSLVNEIHPVLGVVMSVVIYGMIFNTAVGMFYAFARRLTVRHPQRFWPVFAASCLIGFALSFAGFRTLVAYVYPVLGYVGAVLIAVIALAWLRSRASIREETGRRRRLLALAREAGTPTGQRQFRQALAASPLSEEQLRAALSEELTRAGHVEHGAPTHMAGSPDRDTADKLR